MVIALENRPRRTTARPAASTGTTQIDPRARRASSTRRRGTALRRGRMGTDRRYLRGGFRKGSKPSRWEHHPGATVDTQLASPRTTRHGTPTSESAAARLRWRHGRHARQARKAMVRSVRARPSPACSDLRVLPSPVDASTARRFIIAPAPSRSAGTCSMQRDPITRAVRLVEVDPPTSRSATIAVRKTRRSRTAGTTTRRS